MVTANAHAWIELFNNSAGSVNIAGCYLTNDKSNPKKYPIPKGDVLTVIPPRQHTLFLGRRRTGSGNIPVISRSTHQKKITLRYTMQTVKL